MRDAALEFAAPALARLSLAASWVMAVRMLKRNVLLSAVTGLLMIACAKKPSEPTGSTPPDPAPTPSTGGERQTLTSAECEAKSGRVVGDIGDGAIHRPDYTCEGGQPPLGNIRTVEGEPVPIEGAVCCPGPA